MSDCCKNSKFVMLSKKLDSIKEMRGAVIPSLQEAQAIYGYLTPEIIELIASKLKISTEEVYSVDSFYSQFKLQPIGKHRVSVCLGTACYVKGADDVLKKIMQVLNIDEGETTKDGYYSLDTVRCVGCCSLAPLMMIDEKLYAKVKRADVEGILITFKEENE